MLMKQWPERCCNLAEIVHRIRQTAVSLRRCEACGGGAQGLLPPVGAQPAVQEHPPAAALLNEHGEAT
jgi:hypothetical protein